MSEANIPSGAEGVVTPEQPAAAPVESQVENQTPAEAPAPEPVETEAQKLQKAFDKRIARETRQKYELKGRLEALERQIAEQAKPVPQAPPGEPRPEQFQTWEEYIDARADFVADKKVSEKLTQREHQHREAQQAQAQSAQQRQVTASLVKAQEAYPDVIDVIAESDAPMTPVMQHAITKCGEKMPDVLYFLAKNPEEAERIAGLDPIDAAWAIKDLSTKVQRPTKQISQAPAPITPVSGTASGKKQMTEMTQEEFNAHRRKQLARR